MSKGIDYTFGIKNLPSDHIGSIVENKYMEEAKKLQASKEAEMLRRRGLANRGLKSKPTVTSKLRQEASM